MGKVTVADSKLLSVHNVLSGEVIDYGVKMLGAELEWNSLEKVTGAGIKVLVLDTGKPVHKDIIVTSSKNFTWDADDIDRHGHSTHVCGIIAAKPNGFGVVGAAHGVSLYTGKVLDNRGSGEWDWLANGILWGIELGVDVINMSLGASEVPPKSVEDAIKKAYAAGIVLVAASGNTYRQENRYPASYPEVISTAAVDIEKDKAAFSTMSENVEVATAGVDVLSTYLNNSYARLSGTSMSTPHVTAAVALMKEKVRKRHNRNATPDEIRFLLSVYCEDEGLVGRDVSYGYGVLSFGTVLVKDRVEIITTMDKTNYTVNGVQKTMDVAPFVDVKTSRSMFPGFFVGQELGAEVTWDGATRQVKFVREVEVPWRNTTQK